MKFNTMLQRNFLSAFHFATIILILTVTFPGVAEAQTKPLPKEKSICKLKVNNKDYQLEANIHGHFVSVLDLKPFALIPIEITYPQGIQGEKIVISAEDGGTFDNKNDVMVISLDKQKRCTFNFRITDQKGIFDVVLRKGKGTNVIQLWVGGDLSKTEK